MVGFDELKNQKDLDFMQYQSQTGAIGAYKMLNGHSSQLNTCWKNFFIDMKIEQK